MNFHNEPFCGMALVWSLGHGAWSHDGDSRRHVTLWHNIIATSQLPSSLLVILSNNNSVNIAANRSNRELWWGCYAVWWCHGQLDISPFQNIACLGSQTIVEIQGAGDLLKLLTSFTIQNLSASLSGSQSIDRLHKTRRGETRQCKNWFRFRIGSAK